MENPSEVIARLPLTPATLTPLGLIQAAIEKGIDPDQLGKLLDLQERWERNRAEEAYNRALNALQAECPVLVRDKVNEQTKSRYVTMDKLNLVLRPLYTQHGFSVSFSEIPAQRTGWIASRLEVRHVAGHRAEHCKELPQDGTSAKGNPIGAMNPVQSACSTDTYAQRRLLCGWLNITIANEDRDGNNPNALITPDQIGVINDQISDCAAAGCPVDFKKFLAWLGVESLDQLPAARVNMVMNELNRKLAKKVNK